MPHDIVEAVEYGIEYNDWEPFYRFLYESSTGLMFMYSQMGAIIKKDFQTWVDNNQKLESLAGVVPAKKEDNNIVFTKEFMAQLKAILDEYVKTENVKEENGGFYLLPTTDFSTVPASYFKNAKQFRTFRNIVLEKGCLAVSTKYKGNPMRFVDLFSDPDHPILLVGDLSHLNRLETAPHMPVNSRFFCVNEFKTHVYRVQVFPEEDVIYTTCSEGIDFESSINSLLSISGANMNFNIENHGAYSDESWILASTTGEYMRVFVSQTAAQNYSVGNRKVYFTENYYNYVPEDLSVSIDDLQKSVDDLQKVIDELLKQIGNDTSEKEIMDLLKQILEELRNQQGGGGGGGGGDVNIDIDLSTTNSWLSKIYAKVSQIFDKLQSGGSGSTVTGILQDGLDAILAKLEELGQILKKYLSEITGDLDDIKGQLANMSEQEFEEKSDSFIGEVMDAFSEISEVVKTKFPFSIVNDLRIFLSKIAPPSADEEPQEAAYSLNTAGISLYSDDDHVGGGASRGDGEGDAPPGGGGASRPGTGFIDVEHGGGGSSREPAEMGVTAPIFRLPIVIERYGIEEYIIIDMAPFDPLSRFSRSFFTILFMGCLINLTFKVIGLWGDLID